MSSIPEISLPSDSSKVIYLREASVEDAIDFADVDEGREEAVTTLFLNKLQDKAHFITSKTWTGDDRRFMLFWYWLHSTDDTELPITYPCSICRGQHTVLVEGRKFAEEYKDIQGLAERDLEFENQRITVRPLNGEALEVLELMRLERMEAAAKAGLGAGKVRAIDAKLRLEKFLRTIEFSDEKDMEDRKRRIMSLTAVKFKDLSLKVAEKLEEMEHGLRSEFDKGRLFLISPELSCPNEPDKEGVRVSVPFRNSQFIPRV